MLKRHLYILILLADLTCIMSTLLGAYFLRYGADLRRGFDQPVPDAQYLLLAISLTVWTFLYLTMHLDGFRNGWQVSTVIGKTSTSIALLIAAIVICGYSTRVYFSRLVLSYFAVLLWLAIILIRYATYGYLRFRARAGRTRKVIVISDNDLSREIIDRIGRHPELLYEIVGSLSPFGSTVIGSRGSSQSASNVFGSLELPALLKKLGVQELLVLLKDTPGIELQNCLIRCQEEGMRIHLLPQPYELYISRPKLTQIDGVPLITLERASFSPIALMVKRVFDLIVSIGLALPATLVLGGCSGILWATQRRLFRSEARCGRFGRPFTMYRLDVESDDATAPPFHRFLRRLSIADLPQLLNVFRGQMSLVGPRPESPERVRYYSGMAKATIAGSAGDDRLGPGEWPARTALLGGKNQVRSSVYSELDSGP